ncbi:hypothetical protein WEU32_06955 [Brevundimonas sp. BH3]|uniref:hypothetical protein n=1 Tax=Brevundimonas sp. BH3 TaxID=3133089 RepID=UPI00324D1D78
MRVHEGITEDGDDGAKHRIYYFGEVGRMFSFGIYHDPIKKKIVGCWMINCETDDEIEFKDFDLMSVVDIAHELDCSFEEARVLLSVGINKLTEFSLSLCEEPKSFEASREDRMSERRDIDERLARLEVEMGPMMEEMIERKFAELEASGGAPIAS